MLSSVINGARIIKSFGWENKYNSIIAKFRGRQECEISKSHAVNVTKFSLFFQAGLLIAFVAFLYFVIRGKEFKASEAIALIGILNYFTMIAIVFFGNAISSFQMVLGVLTRIGGFLKMDEKEEPKLLNLPEDSAIQFKNVDLTWGFSIMKSGGKLDETEDLNLKYLDLHVKTGELLAVVGKVGCGKTTLLHGIM